MKYKELLTKYIYHVGMRNSTDFLDICPEGFFSELELQALNDLSEDSVEFEIDYLTCEASNNVNGNHENN